MRAIDQGEPLLGGEGDGRDASGCEGFACRHWTVIAHHGLAFTNHDERCVRERGEVAGCADRSSARDERHDVVVEQLNEYLDYRTSHTAMPTAKTCEQQALHATYNLGVEWFAHTSCVRAEEIPLNVGRLARLHAVSRQRTKSRVDPIDRVDAICRRIHNCPCVYNGGNRGVIDQNGASLPRHSNKIIN
jgi:hypothetical protein